MHAFCAAWNVALCGFTPGGSDILTVPLSPNCGSGKSLIPCSRMHSAFFSAALRNFASSCAEGADLGPAPFWYFAHAFCAASTLLASCGLPPGPPIATVAPPSSENFGSGMSTPWSRMHCANLSSEARCLASGPCWGVFAAPQAASVLTATAASRMRMIMGPIGPLRAESAVSRT